jgi:hypothetical protein
MAPEFEVVATLIGFFGFGGFVLLGLKMILAHRARRFQGGGEEARALRDDVQAMRDEVQSLRGDITDLGERMDFTERVLAQSRQEDRRLPRGEAEPSVEPSKRPRP